MIDFHAHLIDEPGYVERLLRVADEVGIEIVCLSGLGAMFGHADNDAVRRAFREHPDRLIGFACIDLDHHMPEDVRRFASEGFRGLKVTCPLEPYDAPCYDGLYAAAQDLNLPILFHMGIVYRPPDCHRFQVSSRRMRPIHLDRIARRFPTVPMVIAHLGMPWYEEAAEMMRIHPNVYADLTSAPKGWRSHKKSADIAEYLWWEGAWEKVLFGTDVHADDVPTSVARDKELVKELRLDARTAESFFEGTAQRLLRI